MVLEGTAGDKRRDEADVLKGDRVKDRETQEKTGRSSLGLATTPTTTPELKEYMQCSRFICTFQMYIHAKVLRNQGTNDSTRGKRMKPPIRQGSIAKLILNSSCFRQGVLSKMSKKHLTEAVRIVRHNVSDLC